ncbi:uncharacterized protein VTP21DRAFT_10561 [Calcarisporiella thermophila]|uniref:uncharacterized protein n=1 Tax=Calcarisporiella thermophila TaxID=911321 RepID=UPI0037447C48
MSAPQKTYQSALCILIPTQFHPSIQRVRQEHDRHFQRWMPHINVIYPFLPESAFEENLPTLSSLLNDIAPFHIRLTTLGKFTHSKSETVFLRPDTTPLRSLEALESRLVALFPHLGEQRQFGEYTPHLSLGQILKKGRRSKPDESWVEDTRREFSENPVEFYVDEVALISRRGFHDPFDIRFRVALGKQNI